MANKRQQELLARIVETISEAKTPCNTSGLALMMNVPEQAIVAMCRLGVREGELVDGGSDFYLSKQIADHWRRQFRRQFGAQAGRREFREFFKLSRNVADAMYAAVIIGQQPESEAVPKHQSRKSNSTDT